MVLAATAGAAEAGSPTPGIAFLRSRATRLLDWLVAFWIFSGGMVLTEPSPYELAFLLVLAVSLLAGFGVHRSTLGLLVVFIAFIPFAIIGAFQATFADTSDALLFVIVTIFLVFTAYWVANYVADAPQQRMRLIVGAYIASALVAAIIGTLGYLGLIPGSELLTRYGRAKAFFNDPNVFGPFLVLPAMYALQRVLLGKGRQAFWGGMIFMTLLIGVFVSFSRAAWGHYLFSALAVFCLVFVLEANGREKVRMLLIAMVGTMMIVVSLAGMLSLPAVSRLFEVRAASQDYDSGETGRFGRQAYAFELALANPLGLGPQEFRNLRVVEEPHNTYASALHVYGWGGGLVLYVFIAATIWRGSIALTRASPNRLLVIPLIAVFVPLSIEAAIIDLDHWRHFFLVAGLIWGVTASYQKLPPGKIKRGSALV